MQAQVCSVRAPHSGTVPEEEVQEGAVSHCREVSFPQGWIHCAGSLPTMAVTSAAGKRMARLHLGRAVLPWREEAAISQSAVKLPMSASLCFPFCYLFSMLHTCLKSVAGRSRQRRL